MLGVCPATLLGLPPAVLAASISTNATLVHAANTTAGAELTTHDSDARRRDPGFWPAVSGSFTIDASYMFIWAEVPYRGAWSDMPLDWCLANDEGIMVVRQE